MGEWGWARYERAGSGTYREVSAAYLRDYVPVRAVPACGEGKMAVSGWEGTCEAVGQTRRVPNRDATSFWLGCVCSHLRTFLSECDRSRPWIHFRTSLRRVRSGGALTTNPPSVYSDVVACIAPVVWAGFWEEAPRTNDATRKVFRFPRHSRWARWTKRLGRMRR